jgi:hypothetical protein
MMWQTVLVSLGPLLVALNLASASVGAIDYNAPLSQAATAFKARFTARDPACRQQSAHQLGISADQAVAFCACWLDVLARNSTAEELAALTAATFGTTDEQDAATPRALEVITRILPERKRVCGH